MSSDKDFARQAPGATGVDPGHQAEAGYRLEVVDAERGVVTSHPAARRKIAICGFAASSRAAAPWDDQEYAIWGLNQLYRHIPRASVWFDIHANWREDNVEGTDHPGWLAQCGIPVYMTKREPSIPTSVRYPIEQVISRVAGTDYFTSSVAFMLGLAIMEIDDQVEADVEALRARMAGDAGESENGLMRDPGKLRRWLADRYAEREIAIFGIDLIVGDEYVRQKQCVEFLLGLAQARNITLRIPPQSALLKQLWRYGYEAEPQQWPVKLGELQKRHEALQAERNGLIARLQTIDGAIQENGYWGQVVDLRVKCGAVKLNEDT